MFISVKLLVSLIAALLLAATSIYIHERNVQQQIRQARRFQQQVNQAPKKAWGNSADTISKW